MKKTYYSKYYQIFWDPGIEFEELVKKTSKKCLIGHILASFRRSKTLYEMKFFANAWLDVVKPDFFDVHAFFAKQNGLFIKDAALKRQHGVAYKVKYLTRNSQKIIARDDRDELVFVNGRCALRPLSTNN